MLKTYSHWKSECSTGSYKSVIAIFGEEKALVEEAVSQIRRDVLKGPSEFNHDRVSAKSITCNQIVDLANSLPMMASTRLVEVDDAESISAEDAEIIDSYIASPNVSSILLFKFGKADLRNKLIKILEKNEAAYNFIHPRLDQMPQIVVERGRQHGLSIEPEVAQIIAMETGTSLLLLERALEKLALTVKEGKISANDVDEQVSQIHMQDAFAFARAVATGDRASAERFLAELELSHEVPLRLVGVLAWQLRQVLKARLLLDQGLSERDISKELSLYGERLRPVISIARKWRREIHVLRLSRLCQLDRELKSSRAKAWHLMEKAVMQLCPSTVEKPRAKMQSTPH